MIFCQKNQVSKKCNQKYRLDNILKKTTFRSILIYLIYLLFCIVFLPSTVFLFLIFFLYFFSLFDLFMLYSTTFLDINIPKLILRTLGGHLTLVSLFVTLLISSTSYIDNTLIKNPIQIASSLYIFLSNVL